MIILSKRIFLFFSIGKIMILSPLGKRVVAMLQPILNPILTCLLILFSQLLQYFASLFSHLSKRMIILSKKIGYLSKRIILYRLRNSCLPILLERTGKKTFEFF